MPAAALGLALGAAFLHAFWNVFLGRSKDIEAATAVVLVFSVVIFAPVAVFAGQVSWSAAPWIAASSALELAYFALLAAAYRRSEVSLVYPVARGLAPVVVLVIAVAAGRATSTGQVLGVCAVGTGVFLVRGLARKADTRGLLFGVVIACCIAGYTLVDKEGVKHASPIPYLELVLAGPAVAYLTRDAARAGKGRRARRGAARQRTARRGRVRRLRARPRRPAARAGGLGRGSARDERRDCDRHGGARPPGARDAACASPGRSSWWQGSRCWRSPSRSPSGRSGLRPCSNRRASCAGVPRGADSSGSSSSAKKPASPGLAADQRAGLLGDELAADEQLVDVRPKRPSVLVAAEVRDGEQLDGARRVPGLLADLADDRLRERLADVGPAARERPAPVRELAHEQDPAVAEDDAADVDLRRRIRLLEPAGRDRDEPGAGASRLGAAGPLVPGAAVVPRVVAGLSERGRGPAPSGRRCGNRRRAPRPPARRRARARPRASRISSTWICRAPGMWPWRPQHGIAAVARVLGRACERRSASPSPSRFASSS